MRDIYIYIYIYIAHVGEYEKYNKKFCLENLKETDHLKDLGIDERIIFKLICCILDIGLISNNLLCRKFDVNSVNIKYNVHSYDNSSIRSL
jgi:hypothetical protein